MSFASNSVVRETFPRVLVNASRTQAVCAAPQIPPNILTYSYNSRLVYVTPGETYEVRFHLSLLKQKIKPSESSKPLILPRRRFQSSETSIAA